MKELDSVSFERRLTVANAVEPPILCVFADASQEAFGACAYVRQKKDDDTHAVKFVAAKSRVAPIKQLTIPRLELQAPVLASRLAKSIQEESRLQFTDVKFFTDSTITSAWIRNSSRSFKPFVSSRVGEIQSTTDPNQWNHIASEDNVADDPSQGIRVNELQGRWMNGPQFLRLPEDQWPIQQTPPPPEEDMERRQIHVLTAVTAQKAKSVINLLKLEEINTCDCTNKKTSRENTTKEIRSAPKRRTANSRRACRSINILDKGSPEALAQPNEERRIQESEPVH